MLKILDRYIISKYLKTFFFVQLIIISVAVVVDYSEKSDAFIEKKAPLQEIIFDYYFSYIPWMANIMTPIAVFIATVFITAKMASHTEIVAMLSSGMSFRRFLRPYFWGSVLLGALTFGLVGWVIPYSAKRKIAFEQTYIHNPYYFDGQNVHFRLNDSVYAYLESYNNISDQGNKFTLEKIIDGQVVEKLSSPRITWDTERNLWKIGTYEIYRFDNEQEELHRGTHLDTALNLYPQDFDTKHDMHQTMTIAELESYIQEQRSRGADGYGLFVNEKYERYAYPFAIVVLTMMGAIVAARKSRGGSGFQIAVGFTLAGIFILFVLLSRNLSESGAFNPMMAAWIPNLTFSFITLIMYFTVPR
jgi:lipopolysaccharide export system permease protein